MTDPHILLRQLAALNVSTIEHLGLAQNGKPQRKHGDQCMDQYPQPMHLVSGISLISPVIALRIVALRLSRPLPIIVGGMSYHRTIAQSAASYPRSWWSVVIAELDCALSQHSDHNTPTRVVLSLLNSDKPHGPEPSMCMFICLDVIHVSICGNDGRAPPH